MTDSLPRRRRLPLRPRQLRVDARPTWRAGCPDGHGGAGGGRVIESSDTDEDQVGPCLGLAEERSAAITAEPAVHSIAAVCDARKVAHRSRDFERRRVEASANRSAAGTQVLAVPAPTGARDDR